MMDKLLLLRENIDSGSSDRTDLTQHYSGERQPNGYIGDNISRAQVRKGLD